MSNQATSEVSICNQALGWLGQTSISSLDDTSRTAQLCKQNYAPLRDAVLESRAWTFATYRACSETASIPGNCDLQQTAVDGYPEWGDGYVHPIKAPFLNVFRVYKDVSGSNWTQANWSREGDNIIADRAVVYLWGVRQETDPRKFSNLFVQCLAGRIAADLAIPITQNRKLQVDMWTLYEAKLVEGAARDGAQGRNEELRANKLRSARYRYGSRGS